MQSASPYAISRDALVSERPATVLICIELAANKLPRILPQERLESQALTVLPYLDDRVPDSKVRVTSNWVDLLVLEGGRDLEGKVPRMLRGTEELQKALYLCSSGQQEPRGELYIQHNICSQLTYFFFNRFWKAISKGRISFALNF